MGRCQCSKCQWVRSYDHTVFGSEWADGIATGVTVATALVAFALIAGHLLAKVMR